MLKSLITQMVKSVKTAAAKHLPAAFIALAAFAAGFLGRGCSL